MGDNKLRDLQWTLFWDVHNQKPEMQGKSILHVPY